MNKETIQQMEQKADFDTLEKLMKAPNNYWHPKQLDYLLHWYYITNKNDAIEVEIFKKLAKHYEIILEVWQIQSVSKTNLRMLSILGVEKNNFLNEFIIHAIKIRNSISFLQKFKIIKQKTFNKYGCYQQPDSFECTVCLDKKLQCLCGKIICQNCDVLEKCPFCKGQKIIRRWVTARELQNFKSWIHQSQQNEQYEQTFFKKIFLKKLPQFFKQLLNL